MTEQELRQELGAALNLASLAENVTTFDLKQRLQDVCKAYAAAQVAELKAELEGVKSSLQGQVKARKRDLASKSELNQENRTLRDEINRLREVVNRAKQYCEYGNGCGGATLVDGKWFDEGDGTLYHEVLKVLLSPKEDGKPIDPPAPDDLPEDYRKTLVRVSGSIIRQTDYAMFWMGVNDGWAKKAKPEEFLNDYYTDGMNFAIKFRREMEAKNEL